MQQYQVGEVLPNGATVTDVKYAEDEFGTSTEQVTETNPNGSFNVTTIRTPSTGTPEANHDATVARLQAALVDNATYLAGNPDPHLAALTRQVNALIRLALNNHDSLAGT